MRRDNMTREDAEECVDICIEEMKEAMQSEEGFHLLEDILQDNLGLEPDYVMGLVGLEW